MIEYQANLNITEHLLHDQDHTWTDLLSARQTVIFVQRPRLQVDYIKNHVLATTIPNILFYREAVQIYF